MKLNLKANQIFGKTDVNNSNLKYYVEKVARFRYGLELRWKSRRSLLTGNIVA